MIRVVELSRNEIEQSIVGLHVDRMSEYDWIECYPVVDGDRIVGVIHGDGYRLAGPYEQHEVIFDEARDCYRVMSEMEETLDRYGEFAHGGDVEGAAQEWEGAGFTPDEAAAWIDARCWDADTARELADAGISPEQAATSVTVCGYADTIGYAVSNGDLTVGQALAMLSDEETDDRLYSTAEAARILGVSRDRVIDLCNAGRMGRKIGRDWVITAADIRLNQERRPGRPKTFTIRDYQTGQDIICPIRRSQDAGEAVLLHVQVPDVGLVAVVAYANGDYCTPRDWQGEQPQTVGDIPRWEWVDRDGQPAVIVDGLPRVMR